jgi:hypothetical protein
VRVGVKLGPFYASTSTRRRRGGRNGRARRSGSVFGWIVSLIAIFGGGARARSGRLEAVQKFAQSRKAEGVNYQLNLGTGRLHQATSARWTQSVDAIPRQPMHTDRTDPHALREVRGQAYQRSGHWFRHWARISARGFQGLCPSRANRLCDPRHSLASSDLPCSRAFLSISSGGTRPR